ncbi:MAG: tRNA (N6-isopentenyl adenosine(37)-C2)-methylthiotransferase MiaB [Tissierellia bacterium]|nr:tRNA (N6-isopentenyl adenosine(37)-C2)-methylthiotransferase MiaB [Tissierellia bacterium]
MKILFTEDRKNQAAIEKVAKLSNSIYSQKGEGPFYHIHTFGCQMNDHDSERMAALLELMGYEYTEDETRASLILLNTCAIREHAEERVYGFIGRLKSLKENDLIIGVCGCMVQQKHVLDKIKKSYPYVDMVFGTHNYYQLPIYLLKALEGEKSISVLEDSPRIVEELPAIRASKISAFVNIMEGCNNFCTYCVVPYTRGREKSRLPEDIIKEVKGLVEEGTREITLLGQNVNSYGRGLEEEVDFPELLNRLNEIECLYRIRFMTSHPKDLSDRLIEAMKLEKMAPSFHLPVQSGSTRVLKMMNRKYTREDYLDKVYKLRQALPHIGLTTDIIVGFPGEELEDLEATISLIEEVGYDSAFTFIYSKRLGTPAAGYEDKLDYEEKHRRFDRMLGKLNEIVIEKNHSRLGQVFEVLVEEETEAGIYQGRTPQGFLVRFPGSREDLGQLRDVKITRTKNFSLEGEICH